MIETMVFHGWNLKPYSFWWFNYGGLMVESLISLMFIHDGMGWVIHSSFFHDGMGFRIGGEKCKKRCFFLRKIIHSWFGLGLWNTNGWALISHPKTSQNILGPWCEMVWRDGRMKIFSYWTNPCRDGVGTCKHYKWNRLNWRCYYLPLNRLNLWYTMIFVELKIELWYDKWSKISIISIIMTMITLLNYVLLYMYDGPLCTIWTFACRKDFIEIIPLSGESLLVNLYTKKKEMEFKKFKKKWIHIFFFFEFKKFKKKVNT